MLQAFTDERWWSAKRDRDTTGGRIWTTRGRGTGGKGRDTRELWERTYALSKCATLCARSMQPPRFYARATVLPFSFLSSVSLLVIFSAILSLFVSHSLPLSHTLFPFSLPSAKCRVFRVLSNDCQVDNLRLLGTRPRRGEKTAVIDSSREENVFKTKGIKPFASVRRTLHISDANHKVAEKKSPRLWNPPAIATAIHAPWFRSDKIR